MLKDEILPELNERACDEEKTSVNAVAANAIFLIRLFITH